jgi:hypothetical protein
MAKEMAADRLEEEAWRRAVDGVEEPVGFYRGEPGAYVRRYSDTLLIFLLKGLRPEKYRERYEHSGGDKPIPVMVPVERWAAQRHRTNKAVPHRVTTPPPSITRPKCWNGCWTKHGPKSACAHGRPSEGVGSYEHLPATLSGHGKARERKNEVLGTPSFSLLRPSSYGHVALPVLRT